MDSDTFTIEVGGKKFHISNKSAASIQGSVLSLITPQENAETKFDRDPIMFRHILNAHRTGCLHVPRDVCPCAFRQEMVFWKIPLKLVAPCCWKTIHELENEMETLKLLIGEEDKLRGNNIKGNQVDSNPDINEVFETLIDEDKSDKRESLATNSLTTRLWLVLEEPGSSTAAKIWCFVYIFMVIVSVVVYVLWSEPSVRVSLYFHDYFQADMVSNTSLRGFFATVPETVRRLFATDPHPAIFAVDVICIVFFVTEAFLSFFVCPCKRKYFFDPLNIIKFILSITMVTSTLIETHKNWLTASDTPNITLGKFYFACKSFNVLRLLLIFRLRKIYNGLHILLLAVQQSVKELLLLAFTFLIAVVTYGCLIFSAEIESEMFPTTQISMWWALITMTTIGYGDFYPTTSYGYLIGSLCAINGLLVIALPVASIAGTFSDLYSRNTDLQKHKLAIKQEEIQYKKTLEEKKE